MSAKKSVAKDNISKSGAPANKLDDIDSHINQHLEQSESGDGEATISNAANIQNIAPPEFDAFESPKEWDAPQTSGEPECPMSYQPLHESYSEAGEVIGTIQELQDFLTESILRLNARLTHLEEKLDDVFNNSSEHKSSTHAKTPAPGGSQKATTSESQAAVGEFQSLLKGSSEQMEHSLAELIKNAEQKHHAFLSGIEARIKAIEKLATVNKKHTNQSTFKIALLIVIVCLASAIVISNGFDHMAASITNEIEAMRSSFQAQ